MKEYRRVCIVNNAYVLFQYFLLSSLDEIRDTYFFFTEDIKEEVAEHFDHARLCLPKGKLRQFLFLIWLNISADYRWSLLKTCEIWGQDNLLVTSPLIKNRKIILLEDGWLNYTFRPYRKNFKNLRKLLFGNLSSEFPLGYSNNVELMYLTGVKKIPVAIMNKVMVVNYSEIWNSSTVEKKQFIEKIFGITKEVIEVFNGTPRVLFTQPLSEDRILSEDEKISIYKKIVDSVGEELIIKTHPREVTDYAALFPNNKVFNKPVPLELLSLIGINFSEVYTLFSSSVLSLPKDTNIHWLGCYGSENLRAKYGNAIDSPSSM